MNLLKKNSFWELGEKTSQGSWMWRKILKLRNTAKTFHKKKKKLEMEGIHPFGSNDVWDKFFAWHLRRSWHYQVGYKEMWNCGGIDEHSEKDPSPLVYYFEKCGNRDWVCSEKPEEWGFRKGPLEETFRFQSRISQPRNLELIATRPSTMCLDEGSMVQATLKYSSYSGLHCWTDSTMDKVKKWSIGVNVTCILYHNTVESRNHLFLMHLYISYMGDAS